jgi:hypothetical protein
MLKKEREAINLLKPYRLRDAPTGLTFQSLAVSLRTTRLNIQKFYLVFALR